MRSRKNENRNTAKHREQVPGWRRASPAAAVSRVCQRLYVTRGKTLVAASWQIRRDGASIRAWFLVSQLLSYFIWGNAMRTADTFTKRASAKIWEYAADMRFATAP